MSVDVAEVETFRSKLTSKCQVTIGKDVREAFDVGPGDEVKFVYMDGELIVRKVEK